MRFHPEPTTPRHLIDTSVFLVHFCLSPLPPTGLLLGMHFSPHHNINLKSSEERNNTLWSAVMQSSSLASIYRPLVPIFKILAASLVRLTLVLSFIIFSELNLFFFMSRICWISTDRYLRIRGNKMRFLTFVLIKQPRV